MSEASNKIYCLVGPSGSGKDTIKNNLMIPHIISYRTRDLREGEEQGVDGHFITEKYFMKLESENRWIAKTNYAGNFYGITQDELLPLEDSPLMYVVDMPGVETLKEALNGMQGYSEKDVVSIYLKVSKSELQTRMIRQGRKPDEISRRLMQYEDDKEMEDRCDYVVMNQHMKVEATVAAIYEIILKEQGLIKEIRGESNKSW